MVDDGYGQQLSEQGCPVEIEEAAILDPEADEKRTDRTRRCAQGADVKKLRRSLGFLGAVRDDQIENKARDIATAH